jgi:hypothetical protein
MEKQMDSMMVIMKDLKMQKDLTTEISMVIMMDLKKPTEIMMAIMMWINC